MVTPDSNHSVSSNSLTLERPLTVGKSAGSVYFVNGTPSDCVHIALNGLLQFTPDLIVSGINQGQNMGDETPYSGTVAAATEGYLFGIPAIAFSQVEKGCAEIDSAARAAHDIVPRRFDSLPRPHLLNLNIPNLPYAQLGQPLATRIGKRHVSEPVYKLTDPFGKEIYWIGEVGTIRDASYGTDFHAAAAGRISITPLQVDLTHARQLQNLREALA